MTIDYVPFNRACASDARTMSLSPHLVRLPMWLGLSETQQRRVCKTSTAILRK
jgi:dTDP-4-amino-4,6-dideoxygalactose transaminase